MKHFEIISGYVSRQPNGHVLNIFCSNFLGVPVEPCAGNSV